MPSFKIFGFHDAKFDGPLLGRQPLKQDAFSDILQVKGLASAIKCTIKLISPDKHPILHELLNGTFKPQFSQSLSPAITIMRTKLVEGLTGHTVFFQIILFLYCLLPATTMCGPQFKTKTS